MLLKKAFEKRRIIYAAVCVSVTVTICLFIALSAHGIRAIVPSSNPNGHKDKAIAKEKEKIPEPPEYLDLYDEVRSDPNEKLAYVTFLDGSDDAPEDLEEDNYLIAVRILIWQLKHNPGTRTKHDVVVMVTPTVSESRRARLKRDGAIIYPVEYLHTENDGWIKPQFARWNNVMTKIRVWQMTQYDRILLLDGDSMLRSSLDGVFDDPGAQILRTKDYVNVTKSHREVDENEVPFPETYLLASNAEVWDSTHPFPPKPGNGLKKVGKMNAGFFIMAPSLAAYNYYVSLLNIPNSFDPKYPEQNLMNYAHRWDGPMPWREIAYTWNIRCPNNNDFAKGLVSMHEKWWKQPYIYNNKEVKDWLLTRRYEMKGWYDAWDLLNPET